LPRPLPPQSLRHLSREAKSVQSLLAHADQIDVLAPHRYAVDAKGVLPGFVSLANYPQTLMLPIPRFTRSAGRGSA
jgi:allophanate hydrolase subunit 1